MASIENILDIVLTRLNNLKHQIIELQTKDQANFDALENALDQVNEMAINIDIRLLDLNNRTTALQPTMLDTQTHMRWIPFDIQPTSQYSARIAGEHSILGPTRIVCLPPASSRRPR
jgi:hypothetical protein